MRLAVGLFLPVAAAILGCWWWLGAPVAMPPSPLEAGEKLSCVSYTPFRGSETPLDLTTRIDASEIEEDLTRLARISGCVRTYSTDFGLDRVAEIAQRHGMQVIQGPGSAGIRSANGARSKRRSRSPSASRGRSAPSSSATKPCCAARSLRPSSPT